MPSIVPQLATLDFETYYDKEYNLTKLTTEAYIRDPRFEIIGVSLKWGYGATEWRSFATLGEYRDYLLPLQEHFACAHNMAFDGAILGWRLGIHPKFLFDTLSMARPQYQMTARLSLQSLAELLTVGQKGKEVLLALGKHRRDFTPAELYQYGEYCKNDTDLTHTLFHILRQGFPKAELKIIDMLLRMFTQPVLELDVPVLQEHLSEVLQQKEDALATVEKICSKSDLMSNNKLADILRSLGVEPPTKVSPTTGKTTLAFSKTDLGFKELLEHDNPQVQAVVGARLGVKSTIEETRTTTFLDVATRGALPVPLKYYGAHTGRVSGAEGSRLNMTNLTRGGKMRQAIKAPPGYMLVIGDSSQIEARKVAWLAEEQELVTAFARGEDIYSSFASKVYGRVVDRKRKEQDASGKWFAPDEAEGFVGKTCILGLGFGMGDKKLQLTLKTGKTPVFVDDPEATRINQVYRRTFRKIVRLWDTGTDALYAIYAGRTFRFGPGGLLKTTSEGILLPNGMLLRYPNLTLVDKQFVYTNNLQQVPKWTAMKLSGDWDTNKLTRIYGGKVIENCVQALARIVVMDQALAISRRYRPVHTVYDDIMLCVPEDEAEAAKTFMEEEMSKAPAWAPGLPIACEVGIGKSYAGAK